MHKSGMLWEGWNGKREHTTYDDGIKKLLERYKKCVEVNGFK